MKDIVIFQKCRLYKSRCQFGSERSQERKLDGPMAINQPVFDFQSRRSLKENV